MITGFSIYRVSFIGQWQCLLFYETQCDLETVIWPHIFLIYINPAGNHSVLKLFSIFVAKKMNNA